MYAFIQLLLTGVPQDFDFPCAVRLLERFHDKEERVRMEVVKAVCDTAAENFEAVPKKVRNYTF